MHLGRKLGRALLAVAALALVGAAAPAFAWDEDTSGECRRECYDARKTCYRAAKAAHKTCRDVCIETDSGRVCRRECKEAWQKARRICRVERAECRLACSDADPACVEGCVDDARACREDLRECKGTCKEGLKEAILECREMVADVCDPKAYRECVHQARVDARACDERCHDGLPCAKDLRACVGDCVDPEGDDEFDSDEEGETE